MSTQGYKLSKKLHLIIGLIGAIWLIFMSVTGILINHQDRLGLGDKEISDRFLPDRYRADVRTGTTRLNVLISDLHSGRFFGRYGYLISDVIAFLLILSVLSGVYIYLFSNRVRSSNAQNASARAHANGNAAQPNRKPDQPTARKVPILFSRN